MPPKKSLATGSSSLIVFMWRNYIECGRYAAEKGVEAVEEGISGRRISEVERGDVDVA